MTMIPAPGITMRALLVRETGWPNAMQVADVPRPAVDAMDADSVLVRVRAAGLNFADTLTIGGSYQEKQSLPFVPGAELCGDVVAVGTGVQGLQSGDRVMGQVSAGAYAEWAMVHKDRLTRVPAAMPDAVAAGFYIPYGTALCALRERGRIESGETLLVLGAAGAVGLAAVQVGKALGARVIGISRSEAKRDAVMQAGADVFVAWSGGDLKDALEKAGAGSGVDVVLDMVGGDASQAAVRCLKFEGRLVIVGFTSGQPPALRANHILVKNIDIVGCYWGPYQTLRPTQTRQAFETLLGWYNEGRLRPQVAASVPLEGVNHALQILASGAFAGKVVAILPTQQGAIA
ncbi:MAG: NADPH:quinone oxidoreductase family protein [Burkholderiaceae bacterium]|nr:NADPH:quinone oxidoreductase family protein [Burkholderiaceae bacterium]